MRLTRIGEVDVEVILLLLLAIARRVERSVDKKVAVVFQDLTTTNDRRAYCQTVKKELSALALRGRGEIERIRQMLRCRLVCQRKTRQASAVLAEQADEDFSRRRSDLESASGG